MTYDGSVIRLFVNGTQVGTRAQTGPMVARHRAACGSAATAVWPEWFAGRLDEIRIYDRALTAAQIQADMTRAVP